MVRGMLSKGSQPPLPHTFCKLDLAAARELGWEQVLEGMAQELFLQRRVRRVPQDGESVRLELCGKARDSMSGTASRQRTLPQCHFITECSGDYSLWCYYLVV